MRAAIRRAIDSIKWRNLRNVARCPIEKVAWGGDVDVDSGGASVPLVWHIGGTHDDARLRAAGVVLEPRFRAGRARFFVELLRLEPHITQVWPFWPKIEPTVEATPTVRLDGDLLWKLPNLS